jgi:hypothetical protein
MDEVNHLARRVGLSDRHLRKGRDRLEVPEPLFDPVLHVFVGLLAGLRDVHEANEPPLAAIDGRPESGGLFLHDIPVKGQGIKKRPRVK